MGGSVHFSQNISLCFLYLNIIPIQREKHHLLTTHSAVYYNMLLPPYTAHEARADLATFPGVCGRHPGTRHCSSPALVLLIQMERLHILKYLGEFKEAV